MNQVMTSQFQRLRKTIETKEKDVNNQKTMPAKKLQGS